MANPTITELMNSDAATKIVAIAPDDNNDLAVPVVAIYVGTGGSVKIDAINGGTQEFKNVPSGMIIPVMTKRVYATTVGVVAADMIGLYH